MSSTLFPFYGIAYLSFEGMKRDFERFGLSRFRTLTGTLEMLGAPRAAQRGRARPDDESGACQFPQWRSVAETRPWSEFHVTITPISNWTR